MKLRYKVAAGAAIVGVAGLGLENGWFATGRDRARYADALTEQTNTAMHGKGFDRSRFDSPGYDLAFAKDTKTATAEVWDTVRTVQDRAGWKNPTARQNEVAACAVAAVTLEGLGGIVSVETMQLYLAEGKDAAAADRCVKEVADIVVAGATEKVYYPSRLAN